MDDLSWARNAVGEMEYQCLTTSMQNSDSGGVHNPRLSPQNVIRYMCPNQCNARGKCVDGECICTGGMKTLTSFSLTNQHKNIGRKNKIIGNLSFRRNTAFNRAWH